MALPHTFPSLLDADASPSVLLIGAGMSFGIAPSPVEVAEELRNSHAAVISKLGVDPSPPPTNNGLYDWAERAFNKLQTELGLDEDTAKVRLADAMGVTTNPRYRANVGTILRKQWPRHRVAARLAREGRWRAIWSLNWDCVLESALECVGLKPHPRPGYLLANPLPWHQWYCTWSPGDAHAPAGQPGTLHVCKPHGCVKKIATGNPIFIVTRSELAALTPRLQPAAEEMNVGFSHSSLVTVGWRADEDYIYANIDLMRQRGTLLVNGTDRLSIINRSWYPTPPNSAQENHNRLATTFGVHKEESDLIVSQHLPDTLQRLWWEITLALTPARWNLAGTPAFQMKGQGKLTVGVKERADTPARYLFNQAERHTMGLAWFFTRYLTYGRFHRALLVLDDPAQEMDQTTFRSFSRVVQALLRLHEIRQVQMQLVLFFHQEDRALDMARATLGRLVMLTWHKSMTSSDPGNVWEVRLLSEGFSPQNALALLMPKASTSP